MIAPQNQDKPPKIKARSIHTTVLLLCGVLFAILGYVIFSPRNDEMPEEASPRVKQHLKKHKRDMASADSVTAKNTDSLPSDATAELSPAWKKYYDGRDTNKWKVVYNPLTKKEYLSRIVKTGLKNSPPPLYKSHSLNLLDAIAFKPIVSPMANVRIDERFMKSLQDGLLERITIDPEDSEEVADRKQNMIALQEELKGRLKNGEDIRQLIATALADRNKVASFKQMMKQERANMRRDGASQKEIDEFTAACNKKLSEMGATPLISKELIEARLESRDSAQH